MIVVPTDRQGQTGTGQGGWTAQRLCAEVGEQLTVAFRRPIPLETELHVVPGDDGWALIDPENPDAAVLEGRPWLPDSPHTEPVDIATAADARTRFPIDASSHPAVHCFSCGYGREAIRVHSGRLDDGRWATPWRAPDWAVGADGTVDEAIVWASIDCASGWYVSLEGEQRHGVTVQLAVEISRPIEPATDYALVSWAGDYPSGWDGRKRGAACEMFDADGNSVARSRSFWVSMPPT